MVQSVQIHGQNLQETIGAVVPFDAANIHLPSAATAAVVTIAADTDRPNVLSQIAWSYSAAPTGGNIKVEDVSGTTVFSLDIAASGPGAITFDPPLCNAVKNSALIITLASGAGAVVGKLFVNARKHV